MSTSTEQIKLTLKGGEFLVKETHFSEIFIPEEFNEEQLMIQSATNDFLEREVMPKFEQIDQA